MSTQEAVGRRTLNIFLSTSDHFMIMLGALLIIFTASV